MIDIADPVGELITCKEQEFRKQWITTVSQRESKGTVLILEPSAEFYEMEDENKKNERSLDFFLRYLSPYKKELLQLTLGMLIGSLLQSTGESQFPLTHNTDNPEVPFEEISPDYSRVE